MVRNAFSYKTQREIRTLTSLRNMQFSHCYFTEKPSSSRGPTQPIYKKMFEKLWRKFYVHTGEDISLPHGSGVIDKQRETQPGF